MRVILKTLFSASLAIAVLAVSPGCALLPKDQLDAAKTGLGYGLTAYANGYQPLLKIYSGLPPCTTPQHPVICMEPSLYKKLYALDGAVDQCSTAAVATLATNSPDFTLVNECVQKAETAKLAIAGAGVKQ